ncbi:hypothetical protein M8494_24765 [Serratia ureilytica]
MTRCTIRPADRLCWNTDTGNGGYTHKFFRYAAARKCASSATPSPTGGIKLRLDGPHAGLQGGLRLRAERLSEFYEPVRRQRALGWLHSKPGSISTTPSSNPADRPPPARCEGERTFYIPGGEKETVYGIVVSSASGGHQLGVDPLQLHRLRFGAGDGR